MLKPLKTERICYKCRKVIKDNSAVGWYIVLNKLYCRECALKLFVK